jgi:hypothetical protein
VEFLDAPRAATTCAGIARRGNANIIISICIYIDILTRWIWGMRFAVSAQVPTHLRDRILQHRRENPERREFADRLLEGVERIEREFSGAERDRLLALALRTFERHVRSARRTDEMRVALTRLHNDHKRLFGILEQLSEPSSGRILH